MAIDLNLGRRRTAWAHLHPAPRCELRNGYLVYVNDEKVGELRKARGGVDVTLKYNGKTSVCEIRGVRNGAPFIELVIDFINKRLFTLFTRPPMPDDFML